MVQRRRFDGQVVWVTGASSGIGEALSRAFAREGARLVLSARRRDALEATAARCAAAREVRVEPLDLAAADDLPARAAAVVDAMGGVDVMVHNAGISQRSLAADTSLAVDRRIMEVNFFGPVALTKALLPSMRARRRGHITVVSSLVGVFGTPQRSAYSASKHALHGFFDALRAEVAGDGLGVTLVCPGFVRTEVSVNALTGDGSPQGTMDTATARGISAERCAEAITDATARRALEVYVGGPERFAAYVKRYAPGVFARMIRRAKVV